MSAKVVALAGANGFVGKAFANAFLGVNAFQLRILTRASSVDSEPLQEYKSRGASLYPVSYEDEASITKALEGVDVLVSAVAGSALVSAQVPLVKAAKAAGVKTFFPSEYGSINTRPSQLFEDESNPSPVIQGKKTVIKAAKEAGLPITGLSTGGFPEYCFIPPFGYAFAEKKVTVWGDGNAKSTWTTVRSVADWLANVLKTVPVEQFQNKHLRIQGNAASVNEVVKLWEQKHNAKLEVEYRPLKELDDRVKADVNDLLAVLLQEWSSGRGEIGGKDNGLYPGWKPEPIESVL
ncbi:Isoflavone reductase-like protein [Ceratobasidium theobromae]|uniref:Isoflavone reductase-like protein n=1 Tax=Ceratobasidium theobromae TaxID=1582974 RepID=A0A5N5QP77_9AGAM|nr:Isoflavone reductase-like protein [Ceratobasidium theobromae]